ncbi:PREDICTED: uncharacterized protein LOC105359653 [Ceratosolen solmsi marchali]|uniref:Uncharacterized protein LOC105359653 n=1 Tax=Ceratosolen solmsi marchali TaxID=326594 RepID=A0AAJ6YBQ5_9HYME|nr:PREDICTED: uncharacterized protein LOC105359653 [Ceratosolen solmsi marchali]
MDKEFIVLTNSSSINHIFTSIAQNSLLLFTNSNIQTVGIIVLAVLTIISAASYMFYRIKDNNIRNISKSEGITRKRELQKCSLYSSKSENFNYNKILNELHNLCNNCTNIFNSLKCIELISNYPQLINVKLSDGLTPFHRVCFHGNDALIEYMLEKGADPELKTVAGENGLCMVLYYYIYAKAENLNCLETLYAKGCHLTFGDEWYKIFLNLSVRANNTNLTKWLLTHSKSPKGKHFNRASSAPL